MIILDFFGKCLVSFVDRLLFFGPLTDYGPIHFSDNFSCSDVITGGGGGGVVHYGVRGDLSGFLSLWQGINICSNMLLGKKKSKNKIVQDYCRPG